MNIEPNVLEAVVENNTAKIDLKIEPSLIYFDGHFDGFPILPGVVQIQWCIELARRYLSFKEKFSGIDVVKFMHLISPGDLIRLELSVRNSNTLEFSFRRDLTILSKGKLKFS